MQLIFDYLRPIFGLAIRPFLVTIMCISSLLPSSRWVGKIKYETQSSHFATGWLWFEANKIFDLVF